MEDRIIDSKRIESFIRSLKEEEKSSIVVRRIEGGINGRLFSVKTPIRYSQKGSDSSIGASKDARYHHSDYHTKTGAIAPA